MRRYPHRRSSRPRGRLRTRSHHRFMRCWASSWGRWRRPARPRSLAGVHELMPAEVAEGVGPKGKYDPDCTTKRHGHEDGLMTLGAGAWESAVRG